MSKPTDVLTLRYDAEQPEGQEWSVALSPIAVGFMATLTDFELRLFAAEASLVVRKTLEMPPSPEQVEKPTP